MRLVGLPGEKVEIVAGKVQINDAAVNPPAAVPVYQGKVRFGNNGCEGHPITLGPDEYYMLGDNTAVAYDSRWWDTAVPGHQPGAVPAGDVIGVATTVYWPPQHWRTLPQN